MRDWPCLRPPLQNSVYDNNAQHFLIFIICLAQGRQPTRKQHEGAATRATRRTRASKARVQADFTLYHDVTVVLAVTRSPRCRASCTSSCWHILLRRDDNKNKQLATFCLLDLCSVDGVDGVNDILFSRVRSADGPLRMLTGKNRFRHRACKL